LGRAGRTPEARPRAGDRPPACGNILIKQGKFDHARALLDTVPAVPLAKQKEKLVAQLPETEKK